MIIEGIAQVDAAGPEDREWAENVLGNSLRPSLSERISEIYDAQPVQVQSVLGQKGEFVKSLRGPEMVWRMVNPPQEMRLLLFNNSGGRRRSSV
jgi:hypothetical protein